jgi:hypothetical protein
LGAAVVCANAAPVEARRMAARIERFSMTFLL